jgi:hypothetical protein
VLRLTRCGRGAPHGCRTGRACRLRPFWALFRYLDPESLMRQQRTTNTGPPASIPRPPDGLRPDFGGAAVTRPTLSAEDVDAIAEATARRIVEITAVGPPTFGLVGPRELAADLGVSLDYVYTRRRTRRHATWIWTKGSHPVRPGPGAPSAGGPNTGSGAAASTSVTVINGSSALLPPRPAGDRGDRSTSGSRADARRNCIATCGVLPGAERATLRT